jgi:glycosyltransferase involved in cell wall biosynthesis
VYTWRQRSDANAVLTLDEGAARRWNRTRGAPAYWLPEPPVATPPEHDGVDEQTRIGCVLYGVLAERKGIGRLARAISLGPTSLQVTLAGPSSAEFQPRLAQYVSAMRATGASVDVRAHEHTESAGLHVLAASRCAVLPYPRHDGMSRVLLEACSVGTPVVVHDRGLLGYLVRRHGLGHAVDCAKPQALRDAILDLTANGSRAADFAEPLARFSARFSRDRFAAACLAPFVETSLQAAGTRRPIAAR